MINNIKDKLRRRMRRKMRIRRKISGSAQRPRLTVYRSLNHIYAQVIDDETGRVLTSASSLEKEVRQAGEKLKKKEVAARVGMRIAEKCLEKNIKAVVFDRNGFAFYGRVEALATAAREKGLAF